MTSLRVTLNDEKLYEGAPTAVPRVGDEVRLADEVVRVSAVVWDFEAGDIVSVRLVTGERPYTF